MTRALAGIVAIFVLFAVLTADAQDVDQGVAKYQSGDFTGALLDLMPFAQQGSSIAQTHVAVMYATGRGVEQHFGDAMIWYRRAAEQGVAQAQYNLGSMHERGEGVPRNEAEAASWYRAAAEQGHNLGQYRLAQMYYDGDGVDQDTVMAYVWANLSAVNGHEEGEDLRDTFAEQLSASDIATAQQISPRGALTITSSSTVRSNCFLSRGVVVHAHILQPGLLPHSRPGKLKRHQMPTAPTADKMPTPLSAACARRATERSCRLADRPRRPGAAGRPP